MKCQSIKVKCPNLDEFIVTYKITIHDQDTNQTYTDEKIKRYCRIHMLDFIKHNPKLVIGTDYKFRKVGTGIKKSNSNSTNHSMQGAAY